MEEIVNLLSPEEQAELEDLQAMCRKKDGSIKTGGVSKVNINRMLEFLTRVAATEQPTEPETEVPTETAKPKPGPQTLTAPRKPAPQSAKMSKEKMFRMFVFCTHYLFSQKKQECQIDRREADRMGISMGQYRMYKEVQNQRLKRLIEEVVRPLEKRITVLENG